MPELGTYGSVRGALSNGRPYRDKAVLVLDAERASVIAEIHAAEMSDVHRVRECSPPVVAWART